MPPDTRNMVLHPYEGGPLHSELSATPPSGLRAGGGVITHDGEGRWPWSISQCPACGGSIEIEKED